MRKCMQVSSNYLAVSQRQQVLHCYLFRAISCKVRSHWWGESWGRRLGRRQALVTSKSFVIFFIFECYIDCWPPQDFFHLDPQRANSTCCVRRFSSIRRIWPSHRRRICWMVSTKLLALPVYLKVFCCTSSLVIFCFQQVYQMVFNKSFRPVKVFYTYWPCFTTVYEYWVNRWVKYTGF